MFSAFDLETLVHLHIVKIRNGKLPITFEIISQSAVVGAVDRARVGKVASIVLNVSAASVVSVASIVPIASIMSVASIASVASIIPVASIVSIASIASVALIAPVGSGIAKPSYFRTNLDIIYA